MRKNAPSIRSRLILLVMACIAPAALMVVLLISYDYRLARAELIRSTMMTARVVALEIDNKFAIVETTLRTLATSPSIAEGDLKEFYAQASAAPRAQNVLNIVLGEAGGKQYINTLRPYGDVLPQVNNAGPLKNVTQDTSLFISNLFTGPISKQPIVAVAIPVKRAGMQPYVLSASMSADLFSLLLASRDFPSDWIGVILDENGTIVGRTHDPQKFVGTKAVPEVLRRLAQKQDGAFETVSADGVPILALLSTAPRSHWTVGIGIPVHRLESTLIRKFLWLVAAFVLLLGGSLALALRLSNKIGDSIRGLVKPALALGAGEVVPARSFGLREADDVGKAICQASETHQRTRHRANHDMLTGLANRVLFDQLLEQQLALCARHHSQLAVLYIDLNDFKTVNDHHGHAIGDKLLQEVATRILSAVRKSDVVARLGGDEFAVILVDTDILTANTVVAKLAEQLGRLYQFDDMVLTSGASIGIATYPESGLTPAALLHSADKAMYRHKSTHKTRGTQAQH